MSDTGGFGLPGFDTGGRKLRASGTIRVSIMLLTSQTLGLPTDPSINNCSKVDPGISPSYQLTVDRLRRRLY